MPRLSLALPVYNGAAFLKEAIESILDQDYADFELLITDNCSTDGTEEICRGFAARDKRIRYLRNAENLGAAANFNLGFRMTSGEYFKWCADDDKISQNYLSACVRALDEAPGAAVACGELVGMDADGNPTSFVEGALPDLAGSDPGIRFRRLLPQHVLVAAVFGVYRRDVLQKTSLHRPYYSSDCALLAEVILLGGLIHVPEAVLYNREHPARSCNLDSRKRAAWQNPRAAGSNPLEISRRIAHLAEITWRHRRAAPLATTWPFLLLWVLNPVLIGRLGLEAVGALSPGSRQWLRRIGLRVLGLVVPAQSGPKPSMGPDEASRPSP